MLKVKFETKRTFGNTADKIGWDIGCPQCDFKIRQTVAQLRDDPTLTCPSCSHVFKIESGGTAQQMAQEISDLDKLFDSLGK